MTPRAERLVVDVGDQVDAIVYDDVPPEIDVPRPAAGDEILDPLLPMGELDRAQLERELAFGAGVRQVLARDELERRSGDGHQPSLFGPLERLRFSDR